MWNESIASRFCRGPHALECDANISGSFHAHRRTRNKLLNHLGIEVLHRELTKKRNKVLPNVSPVVDCRGISELTQHFFFPVLSEVSELGRWPWPIADFVDVSDSVVQRPLSKSFRWIVLKRPNRLFASDTLPNPAHENIFTPSAIPGLPVKPQLSLLIPASRHRVSFSR